MCSSRHGSLRTVSPHTPLFDCGVVAVCRPTSFQSSACCSTQMPGQRAVVQQLFDTNARSEGGRSTFIWCLCNFTGPSLVSGPRPFVFSMIFHDFPMHRIVSTSFVWGYMAPPRRSDERRRGLAIAISPGITPQNLCFLDLGFLSRRLRNRRGEKRNRNLAHRLDPGSGQIGI